LITLRDLVKSDTAIAAITTDECKLIARVLEEASRSWLRRIRRPHEAFALKMIAATLGRTPAERQPSFQEKVRLSMTGGAKPKDEWSPAELEGKHG